MDSMNHFSPRAARLKATIAPLFKSASPGDPPALECQIALTRGYNAMGTLSPTELGTLTFVAIGQPQGGGRAVMAQHYFDWEDLLMVIVMKEPPGVAGIGSRIITG
jgi:hypothetical protein